MPRPGIELTSVQLDLFWGTLIQDTLPIDLPRHWTVRLKIVPLQLLQRALEAAVGGHIGEVGHDESEKVSDDQGHDDVNDEVAHLAFKEAE